MPLLALDPKPGSQTEYQRTTFAIDVLARNVCNLYSEGVTPPVPQGTPKELVDTGVASDVAPFDAIVIGSGMYGAYMASRLYRMGARVLVLEAGPFLISEHYQNLSVSGFSTGGNILARDGVADIDKPEAFVWGQPWRGDQLFRRQAFCVGGKSIYWGGWSPRLTDDVLDGPLPNGVAWPSATVTYFRDPAKGYERTELEMGVRELVPDPNNPGGPRIAQVNTDFFNSPQNLLNRSIAERVASRQLLGAYEVRREAGSGQPAQTFTTTIEAFEPAPIAVQAQAPSSGLFGFDKFSSLPLLTEAIREDVGRSGAVDQRRRIFVVPNTKVLRLQTTPDGAGARVTGVEILGQPAIPVSPNTQVILALSSIESTRIALDSFRSIPPLSNLMGRNFMAHIRNNVTLRIRRSVLGLNPTDTLETAAFHIVGKSGTGGRYHFQFYAGYSPNREGDAVLYRMVTDPYLIEQLQRNQDPEWVSFTFRGCGEMVGQTALPAGNNGASYIDLSTSTDGYGNIPRAWVHLVQQGADLQVFDEMDQVIFEIARKLATPAEGEAGDPEEDVEVWAGGKRGWVKLRDNPFAFNARRYGRLGHSEVFSDEGERGIRDGLGTTWHESGTLWMGESPTASVLDPTGRFHQVPNAWCVDQAAFPRVGSANPVPTGITIARLAAETIVDGGLRLVEERDPVGRITAFYHDPGEAGYEPLFVFERGVDVPRGWRHFGSDEFTRFGAVLETSEGIGLLCYTARQFTDFTLKLQYRAPTLQNNSGVYVRLPAKDEGGEFVPFYPFDQAILTGYEIQIDNTGNRDVPGQPVDFFNRFHQTGALYPVHPQNKFPEDTDGALSEGVARLPLPNGNPSTPAIPSRPLGQWNDMEIRVGGDQIKVLLNDVSTLEGEVYTDTRNSYPVGLIALQNHFKGFRVQFRHLRIKEGSPTF